jgi:secreted trypsin-like serine protease
MERLMALSTAVVLACVLSAGPASANTRPRTSVIGGQPASIASYPFMARITASEADTGFMCSGTVVSPNMVLTAAHCLLNESETAFLPLSSFRVMTGSASLAASGPVSTAERLVIDSGYVSSGSFASWHDAGLIQLTAPISAPAVKLATSQIWEPGTLGYIVGWGVTEPEQSELPEQMQVGETVVQSTSYCQSAIGTHFHPVAELCTLDYPSYESATCNGDSGGPLLMVNGPELVQIGITSFGPKGCPTDSPRVDTRVDVEAAWVQHEIASHPPREAPKPPAPPAPPPKLPLLTTSEAKHDTFNVLRTDARLRSRFRIHAGYRVSCRRLSKTSVKCNVNWYQRPNDYWGSVTIFLTWAGSEPVWGYRYTIRGVNDWCYWYSGHRARCPIQTIRG